VYDAKNVQPGGIGLTVKQAGEGYAVFEIRSPYVIVPLVGDLDTTADDREASVVKIDADGAALSLSLDNGLTWRDLGKGNGAFDLTPFVAGTYGYLLKIALRGKPEEAVVRSLEITTWVQVHPASLPSLREGRNEMRYVRGDHYGLPSRVVEVRPNAGDPGEFLKHLVEPPADYDPARGTSRVRGALTAKVQAPPGARIAWFSAGASFATYQGKAARNTRNTIAYAVEEAKDFEEIYRAEIPTDQAHWHYNVDREVRLDEPATTVYVRYVGDPALNNIRIYAHCVDDDRPTGQPVVITHVWGEDGARKSSTVSLDKPSSYVIEAASDTVDESVELSVPSDAHGGAGPGDAQAPESGEEGWVAAMKRVHANFRGRVGTFAQFGDSITVSRAFWFSLRYDRKNAPEGMAEAFKVVSGHMLEDCWDRKGPQYGNEGQMTIRWAHQNVDRWLRELNPEVAIIMFGTNDLDQLEIEEYESKIRQVVKKCLDNGTIVILSTIPPRHGRAEKAAAFAQTVRKIAGELKVPLTDYHAEVLRRRPDDWDGALEQFRQYEGYEVPTLISRDGVHPSNPREYQGDYSAEALQKNGYSLRNYLVLLKYAEVIREVLQEE
jgi:lysophospholipase L1-like esterase